MADLAFDDGVLSFSSPRCWARSLRFSMQGTPSIAHDSEISGGSCPIHRQGDRGEGHAIIAADVNRLGLWERSVNNFPFVAIRKSVSVFL